MNYGPDEDPLAILRSASRAAISVYAKGDDYHELIKARLKEVARWLVAECRRRGESVRRHRGGDGKAAGRQSRARLAGQAHQFGVAPIRLVAVSRLDLHHARSAGRRGRSRTVAAPAAPVSTFARPRRSRSLTGSMRGAAFRISPSSTRDRSRANCAPLMGNRIYGCDDCLGGLPVEQVRGARPRGQARRARGLARAQARRACRASTTRNSARCLPRPRSSAPAATVSCAMC